MSVGILDGDIIRYVPLVFNLEAMKIATYYKKQNQIVVMAPSFSPSRNTKFVYRKDYDDGFFPSDLHRYPNVEYGGLAFTNNKYAALPEDIEKQPSDLTLYDRMLKRFRQAGPQAEALYRAQMKGEHCRLSLDGKTIWPKFESQLRGGKPSTIFIHDYNLGTIEGGFDAAQSLLKTNDSARLGLKFPVQVRDPAELIKWSGLDLNSPFYGIIYHGILPNEAVNEWILAQRQRAAFLQMEYHITAPWLTEQQIIDELPKIFQQIIVLRAYRAFCRLTFEESFFSDPRWNEVLLLFNAFLHSHSHKALAERWVNAERFSMYDYVCSLPENNSSFYGNDTFTRATVRPIFNFVREKNYPLFQMFYETTAETLGGKL